MKISFTGTRKGMTERQKSELSVLLIGLAPALYGVKNYFTHGGAHGADTDAHEIAMLNNCEVFIMPGSESQSLYWFDTMRFRNCYSPKPYLERNRDIVEDGEILIAAPKSLIEEIRSGTWATIRYARKMGKPIIILDP